MTKSKGNSAEMKQTFGQRMLKFRLKHGYANGTQNYNNATYYTWLRMRVRCKSKNSRDYIGWGSRGITICKEWDNFSTFIKDMGEKPSTKHSLDRIDNDKGYSKENCRWATQLEQHNNKRSNRWIEFDGKKQTQAQWSRELGLSVSVLNKRLKTGWTIERALTVKDGRKTRYEI